MVALQFLVLSVLVRIQVGQLGKLSLLQWEFFLIRHKNLKTK